MLYLKEIKFGKIVLLDHIADVKVLTQVSDLE